MTVSEVTTGVTSAGTSSQHRPQGQYEHQQQDPQQQKPKIVYHPLINGLQKIALYETKMMYYLIGSNATQSKFRVLKIDRTEPEKLIITDDKVVYSHEGIRDMLGRLSSGNREDATPGTRLSRATSAFGIVGFVRFLKGYYLILVTKRRKVASVGLHSIYKIEDTCIRYIPHESYRGPKHSAEEEQRYLKLFLNVDLSANFYFSYSYDLSHTLQYNLAPPVDKINVVTPEELESFLPDAPNKPVSVGGGAEQHVTYWPRHDLRYVWNCFLHDAAPHLHHAWRLYATHGFVEQVNISVFGHSYYLTLLARRSRMFAGTRFLKRGTNSEGEVANEVETEQIVFDSAQSNLPNGHFTSFVQVRGSIPAHWSQDVTKMVPKPPIFIYHHDPLAIAAGRHFRRLLARHGAPILVLDLTKRRESRRHESALGPYYKQQIDQLNLTAPPAFRLDYRSLDMAQLNKKPNDNAMNHLSLFSAWALNRTGVFFTKPNSLRSDGVTTCLQTGVVRVNCVDCLDRTNTAQYALAKCALAHQLYLLGVISSPSISWDSDCTRVLEALFEDHGDTLALQYGGSQLVHRIKTYRHTAKWSSHGSDMMQSLSRYYSNTFSDVEKQQSINVFLGLFVPHREGAPLWELASDHHLHNPRARGILPCFSGRSAAWWDRTLADWLPLPLDVVRKTAALTAPVRRRTFSCIDLYNDFHRPSEMTVMTDHFLQNITSTFRAASAYASNPSPFCSRVSPNKQQRAPPPLPQHKRKMSAASIAATISGGGGGVDDSRSSRRRRSSLALTNSSSDGEASDEDGIWPPLDDFVSVPSRTYRRLSLAPLALTLVPALATALAPALASPSSSPLHFAGFSVKAFQISKEVPFPQRGENVSTCLQNPPSTASQISDILRFSCDTQELYRQQRQHHIERQRHFGQQRSSPCPSHQQRHYHHHSPSPQQQHSPISSNHPSPMSSHQPSPQPSYQSSAHSSYQSSGLSSYHGSAHSSHYQASPRCYYRAVSPQQGRRTLVDTLFPPPQVTYGHVLREPNTQQLHLYERYARMAEQQSLVPSYVSQRKTGDTSSTATTNTAATGASCYSNSGVQRQPQHQQETLAWRLSSLASRPRSSEPLLLVQESTFKQDSYLECREPTVDRATRVLYAAHVRRATHGATCPDAQDMDLYRRYAAMGDPILV